MILRSMPKKLLRLSAVALLVAGSGQVLLPHPADANKTSNTISALPGTLDPTFGDDGIVITEMASSWDRATGVAVQEDGKIVAGGYANPATDNIFALARYNSDGTLDADFGTGGKVTNAIGLSSSAFALAIQTDGKIVQAGSSNLGTFTVDAFALARYNTNGSQDSSFGSSGQVRTPVGSDTAIAYALVIQPNGKIVAAGLAMSGGFNEDFALVRYNSDGNLDSDFGTGGKVTTPVGSGNDRALALAIQSDNKLIAVGPSNNGSQKDFALVRYNSDGSLDSSFGSAGKVTTAVGSEDDYPYAIAIQSDGKLVVAGSSSSNNQWDTVVVRYNADGSLDTTFGTGGKIITAVSTSHDSAHALIIQSDGKLVTAGYAQENGNSRIALVRYNQNGVLDTTFGTGGKVQTVINTNGGAAAYALAIQSDGKLVAAGDSGPGWGDFTLVRYVNPVLNQVYLPLLLRTFSGGW